MSLLRSDASARASVQNVARRERDFEKELDKARDPDKEVLSEEELRDKPWSSEQKRAYEKVVRRNIRHRESETVETARYSPEYHEYLGSDQFPGDYYHLPISDFSTPQNISVFGDVVRNCVDHVERGHIVVAHCRAGIGRSGLFAISVLAMIGLPDQDAIDAVRAAGGQFETAKQQKFLLTFRKTLDS